MKEALVYQKLANNKVRCQVCQRRCLIPEGQTGVCLTKLNLKGELYTLNYGLIQGIQVDPIEKKPFYHFHPGKMVPSIGSYGCNFRCKQCLNWHCSWGDKASLILKKVKDGKTFPIFKPDDLIKEVKNKGYRGIAFTYNEPVVWAEYVLDAGRLAVFVTNGSWTKQTLDKIGPYLDAANIDLKGFSVKTYARQGAFFGEIPEMMVYAQEKQKIFLEITTLIIPEINDDPKEIKKMCQWIVKNLGPKTPWHLSRYSPDMAPVEEFQKIPATPIEKLKKAAEIGKKAGLEFVYIWAPGADLNGGFYAKGSTSCPKCNSLAVNRSAWEPEILGVNKKGKCKKCGEDLKIKV
jgi:pyruvate formate lyase activating enzyme